MDGAVHVVRPSELVTLPNTKIIRTPVSRACLRFVENTDDIRAYYTLYQEAKNRRVPAVTRKLSVVSKAMFVLVAALWEAYCEDVADEGLRLLVQHSPSWDRLPRPLLKVVSKELRSHEVEFAPWSLAGEGWRTYLTDRMEFLGQRRNYSFATPKAANVDRLFLESMGIVNISDSWTILDGPEPASAQLDRCIDQRNVIAHRYASGTVVEKRHVKAFFNLVARLVAHTDASVGQTLLNVTGETHFTNGSPSTSDLIDISDGEHPA